MSRYISERLDRKGSKSKRCKFELVIHDLQCQGPAKGNYQVVWTRGPKVAVSKFAEGFNDDQGQCGVVIWDETLTLVSTVYRIGGTDSYKRKQSKISIKKSSGKTIGKIRFDIAKFVDDEEGDAKNIQFVLEKCKDPDARLSVSLRCRSVAGNSDDMPSLASMPSMGSMESLDSYDSPPSQSQNSRQASVSRKYSGSRKYSDSRGQNKPNSTAPTFSRAGSHNNRPDSGGSYEQKTPDIGRLPRPTSFKSDDIGGSGRRPPPDADQSDEGAALRAYYEKRVAELTSKIRRMQEDFERTSEYFSRVEVEYVNVKVELVDTVDRLNDVEQENTRLGRELAQCSNQIVSMRSENDGGVLNLFR